ncbi:MAG: S8 family serine peptidase [Acidobacteriota bacterium]
MLDWTIGQGARSGLRGVLTALALPLVLLGCAGFGSKPSVAPDGSASGSNPASSRGAASGAVSPEGDLRATSDLRAASQDRQILVTLTQADIEPLRAAGSTSRQYVGSPTYARSERTRRAVARLARDYRLQRVEGWPIQALGVYCVVFEVPPGRPLDEVIDRLARDARVESVQPMQRFEVLGAPRGAYDDPYLEMQHGLDAMRVLDAHPVAGGRGVTLAVVDTGVDRSHSDLADSVELVRDFVGAAAGSEAAAEPLSGTVAELHGTAVTGVIASTANNGIGTVGVAPASRILALRACWEQPGQASGVCNSFTLAKALAFVVDRRPDIVNLSLAGPRDPLLERLLKVALAEGIAVVAAYDREADAIAFPACMDGVLVVQSDAVAAGPEDPDSLLRAPGRDILAAHPGDRYDFVSGSSFAAAHVAGVVALLLEHAPGLDAAQLDDILRSTSRVVTAAGTATRLIDACAALDRAIGRGCELSSRTSEAGRR